MQAARYERISDRILLQAAVEIPSLQWVNGTDSVFSRDFADHTVLRDVEIVFGRPHPECLAAMPTVKWIHVPYAGVDTGLCRVADERGILVTNSSGIYNQTIAEHALCLMLGLARRLDVTMRNQFARHWDREAGQPACDLSGSTVAVFGAGGIGQAIARLCKAFGMQVLASRRHRQPTPFVDRLYDTDDLVEMVRGADWLVIAAPLTNATNGAVDAKVLATLPRGARLINVSRGKIVDESALVASLRSGHLAGAALDVTAEEPLPASSSLWELPGVLITPHVAGAVANTSDAAAELFLRNLHHHLARQPLESIVDFEEGY